MQVVQLKDRPDLKAIVKAVDPKFRRQKAFLRSGVDRVCIRGTYWDEGSITDYHLVNIATLRVTPIPRQAPPQFGGAAVDPMQCLQAGECVVATGVCQGLPATPVIYMM